MRCLLILLVLSPLLLAAAPPASAPASAPSIANQPLENFRYTVVFDLLDNDGDLVRTLPPVHIIFIGDRAVAVDKDDVPRIRFDLKRPSIRSVRGDGGTLDELQRRAGVQRKRVLDKINDFKDPQRMRNLYDPQLKAEQDGQMLKLSNALMSYEIQLEPIAEPQRRRLYLLQRLQDYLNPKIDSPPFASLAVTDELEKRQSYGKQMKVVMGTPGGDPQSVRSTATIAPLNDEELRKYEPMLP